MKIGLIGLGRMGGNMARRLSTGGHIVAVYNRTAEVTQKLHEEVKELVPTFSIEELIQNLKPPRVIWIMVPAGRPTDDMLHQLADLVSPGDIFIDGGNSNFRDTLRRSKWLADRNIHFIDVGVSGGIWGLKEGYSLMIGGEADVIAGLNPIFQTLAPAPDRGWGRVGPHGSGHFVKMVHNGIEYGMMEALAEGFEIMRGREDFDLNLYEIAEIWRYGSVVRSWLLDLTSLALQQDPELKDIEPWVADSGEGRWTVMEAINENVPAPVIALSLFRRFESRQEASYSDKLLAAMRNKFGGHAVKTTDEG